MGSNAPLEFFSHMHKMKIDVNWNAKDGVFFIVPSLLQLLRWQMCTELRNRRLVANAFVLKPAR